LHFQAEGAWSRRFLRFLLGMILVLTAYIGLNLLFQPFSQGSYLLGQSLRFVRYAMVGFIVPGLAPWLFLRLHLAEKEA